MSLYLFILLYEKGFRESMPTAYEEFHSKVEGIKLIPEWMMNDKRKLGLWNHKNIIENVLEKIGRLSDPDRIYT